MTLSSIQHRLDQIRRNPISDEALVDEAIALAADLLKAAQSEERSGERRQAKQMARMMNDPAGKAFTLAMADQVFRPPTPVR